MKAESAFQLLCFLLALIAPQGAESHLWMQCPKPRHCFYQNPLGSTNGDGEWRTAPCPHKPRQDPKDTTYLVAGQTFCMRVREFVDHVGWLDVNLASSAVAPGDSQSVFHTQLAYVTEQQNGTSYLNIPVTIPAGTTCNNTCTLQMRQWSEDLGWYYYACADVRIVQSVADLPAGYDTQDNCTARIQQGTCEWESGGGRVPVHHLQTILMSLWVIVFFLVLAGLCVFQCCRARRAAVDSSEDENSSARSKGVLQVPTPRTTGEEMKKANEEDGVDTPATAPPPRHWAIATFTSIGFIALCILTVAWYLSTGTALIILKTCSYDTSGEVSL